MLPSSICLLLFLGEVYLLFTRIPLRKKILCNLHFFTFYFDYIDTIVTWHPWERREDFKIAVDPGNLLVHLWVKGGITKTVKHSLILTFAVSVLHFRWTICLWPSTWKHYQESITIVSFSQSGVQQCTVSISDIVTTCTICQLKQSIWYLPCW